MISERAFAASFAAFWSELLPLLTPSLVHMLNEQSKSQLADRFGLPLATVRRRTDERDQAVLAELAFDLARLSTENNLTTVEAFKRDDLRSLAERSAFETISRYERDVAVILGELGDSQREEALELAQNYDRFFSERRRGESIHFRPPVPGCGFLSACRADISIGGALFEVKTVSRNIASKDIRQLVVYLALQSATGESHWRTAGFFNPRRGIYHEFVVSDLVQRMSGGRSAAEVFQALVDYVGMRDVQIDTPF